jgi:hypothetical protein
MRQPGNVMASRQEERRIVGTSGGLDKNQDIHRLQGLPARILRKQKLRRLQELFVRVMNSPEGLAPQIDRALIAAEIEVSLEAWSEEAM